MNLPKEATPPARIGRDGESVRCGAGVTTDATGAPRYTCGEKLGARWYEEQFDESEPRYYWAGYGFYLPKEFGLDANGAFYRHTKRPHYRTEGKNRHICLISSRHPVTPRVRPKPTKQIDREFTDWGDAGTFVLPICVMCPRCKKLNLITESLIESEPEKLAA